LLTINFFSLSLSPLFKQVVEAIHHRGPDLVMDACNKPKFLEELSGLAKLQADTEEACCDFGSDDELDDF
jgi:hypothetical protein